MKAFTNYVVIVVCSFMLMACASGATSERMVVSPVSENSINSSNKYFQSIILENVSGGKETNALLVSKVSNAAFYDALKKSLDLHGFLNDNGSPKYKLNAELLALEQPVFGLSFTVDSVASYNLKSKSGQVLLNETIKSSGTATMGDAFVGTQRLRMANENAMKNNIQNFIDRLK